MQTSNQMRMQDPIHYQNQYQPQDQYAMQQPQQDQNQQSYQTQDVRMYNTSTNRNVRFSDQDDTTKNAQSSQGQATPNGRPSSMYQGRQ